jgi:hypothetical protein
VVKIVEMVGQDNMSKLMKRKRKDILAPKESRSENGVNVTRMARGKWG